MTKESSNSTERRRAETYLASMSYPQRSNVFILGCADKGRITVASQQNRATSLVNALHCCGKLKTNGSNPSQVGIIGAGVAGVTAAMLAAKKGAIVHVFDKVSDPLNVIKYATHRFIHPNLFNWPNENWAKEECHEAVYPQWRFASAEKVAEDFYCAFQEKLQEFDNLRFNESGAEEKRLDLNGDQPRIISNRFGDGKQYDFVFVCTGFGTESYEPERFENPYWHPDDFHSENESRRKYTVIGTGDGGLIDVLRLRIGLGKSSFEGFLVGLLVEWELREPIEYKEAVEKIRCIEGELPKEGFNLNDYCKVPAAWFTERIKGELRQDTDVTLVSRHDQRIFGGFQSRLNRFLFSVLVRTHDEFLQIKIGEYSDDGEIWKIIDENDRNLAISALSKRPVLRINTKSSPVEACIPSIIDGIKEEFAGKSRFDLHVEPFIYPKHEPPNDEMIPRGRGPDDNIPSRPSFSSDTGIDLGGTPDVTRKNPYLLGGIFVGREEDKAHLTEFLKDQTGKRRVLCVTDFGGGGKSALVWDWLTSKETQTLRKERGFKELWVSFYARDYNWQGFFFDLAELLDARMPRDSTRPVHWKNTADEILHKLKHGKDEWLLVLDGFEREMDEYASEANFGADSEQLDTRKETADKPDSRIRNEIMREFIFGLLDTNAKVLISSRLFPESLIGVEYAKEYSLENVSLTYENARTIWRHNKGLSVNSVQFKEFLELIAYHPQTIAVVAAAIGASRDSNTSFGDWVKTQPDEKLTLCYDKTLHLTARRHRWLELATADLQLKLKRWILLCRVTSRTDASSLPELEFAFTSGANSLLKDRKELVTTLNDLKKRQVVGFDESSGFVDVHPVIRSVVYSHVSRIRRSEAKKDQQLWEQMKSHLQEQELLTKELSALPPDERLKRKDDFMLLDANTKLELLKDFYPNGHRRDPWDSALPTLQLRKDQASVEFRTAAALSQYGNMTSASKVFDRAKLLFELLGDNDGFQECESFESWNMLYGGSLFDFERYYLKRNQQDEATEYDIYWLAMSLSIRGLKHLAKPLLKKIVSGDRRWFLQTTSEAYLYLGLYRSSRNLALKALRSQNEPVNTNQELWELVTLGWAYLRLNQPEKAYQPLNAANKGSGSTYYLLVRLFALAGLAEYRVQVGTYVEHAARRRELVGGAFQVYKEFEKRDPQGTADETSSGGLHRYTIPAAEILLSVAKARLAIDEREEAYSNAFKALQQAYGDDDGFSYFAGVERAKSFLNAHFKGRDLPEVPKSRRKLRNHDESLAKFVQNYLENK